MIAIMSEKYIDQLAVMAKRKRSIDAGACLFHRDDPVAFVFIVEKGILELTRCQRDGRLIVLQRAEPRAILAEASVYSQSYHCDAIAAASSTVACIDKTAFLERLAEDPGFSYLWSSHLAGEMMKARHRSEILCRKTVAERLDAWLDWRGQKLPPKGERKAVAAQIGVSPEALYRELARRK